MKLLNLLINIIMIKPLKIVFNLKPISEIIIRKLILKNYNKVCDKVNK
jgi:hypothetical protein